MLQEQLTELNRTLNEYAGIVERMLAKSITGLAGKDPLPLHEVVEKDEPAVNEYETRMDEKCATIIAQFHPKAMDLRNVLMVLKMNNDLERIGDHVTNIAGSTLYLIEKGMLAPCDKLPMMQEIVMHMFKDSMSAFTGRDTLQAARVSVRDGRVNGLRDEIMLDLVAYMRGNHSKIKNALHVLRIATNLERIADLSKNICEDVIFLVEGKVTKHHHDAQEDDEDQDGRP